jgi:hypothetical protein
VKSLRFLLFLFALPLLNLVAQTHDPGPLTNQRVIQLFQSGVRSDEMLRVIGTAPSVSFNLTPADTDMLLRAGVSEEAIKMMAARENGLVSPTGQIRPAGGNRPRVFVTDSPNAWSANATPFGFHAGSHPQTAEIMKTIGHECPNATVTNNRQNVSYVVVLERESQKFLRRDNKMAIFDQAGDLVYSASNRELGNAVRNGCIFFK